MIIGPHNWWNMQRNDLTLLMFIVYSLLLPYTVSYSKILKKEDVNSLFFFDIIFIIDRIVDLFKRQSNDSVEAKPTLLAVITNNISYVFFLEWIMSFGPIIYNQNMDSSQVHKDYHPMSPITYFLFKLPRYIRIFEMQTQIADILEYYS